MTKKDRLIVFKKFNGKCAYCGEELQKGWHVDEVEPVRRNHKWNREKGRYEVNKENPMMFPERLHIDNQYPACRSCNIQKNSFSLEEFRNNIQNFVNSLNAYSTQYKFAKRYGLVQETEQKVEFYFEKHNNQYGNE
jgi:5-methylcytosine-specific restriction endonuclease McrA